MLLRPSLFTLLGLALVLGCGDYNSPSDVAQPAYRAGSRASFGINGTVSGAPTGAVRITGGGSFAPASASNVIPTRTSASAAGGFDCTATVAQGPLTGCEAGQGVRWDTAQLLESAGFRCTGTDAAKSAATSGNTAVLLADFYRAGDGNDESFTAQMIVSSGDIAPDIDGVQNLWIQGVGCGTGIINFNGNSLVIQ